MAKYIYTGKIQPDAPQSASGKRNVYLPEKGLVNAVNLAIQLKRPLLLTGDPGVGKTRLGEAVAREIYREDYKDNLFFWSIKSSSKAKDGIYTFDPVKYLFFAQDKDSSFMKGILKKQGTDLLESYLTHKVIKKGKLAQAIDKGKKSKIRPILIIDEIDKANVDFGNDLLMELDEYKYYIEETDTLVEADKANLPIIIITSNMERELSSAFLRRCLYYHISFPAEERLQKILENIFGLDQQSSLLASLTVNRFRKIRESMAKGIGDKFISTSELIDWFEVIKERSEEVLSVNNQEKTIAEWLTEEENKVIPFYQVLLKNWDNIQKTIENNQLEGDKKLLSTEGHE